MDVSTEHIKIEEGKAYTINRTVKVRMIAVKYLDGGMSADEIAEHYSITPGDVYAALAYYYDNKAAYDEADRRIEALIEKHKPESDAHMARLRAKIEAFKQSQQG